MTAYIQSLPEPASAAALPAACPLHVRLRDYMAALPEHVRERTFRLEELCEALDADPVAMTRALCRCGFVRHVRHYVKNAPWVFWQHWSSPHQF